MKLKQLLITLAILVVSSVSYANYEITLKQQIIPAGQSVKASTPTDFAVFEVANITPFPVNILVGQDTADIPNLPVSQGVTISKSTCSNAVTTCEFTLSLTGEAGAAQFNYTPEVKVFASTFPAKDSALVPAVSKDIPSASTYSLVGTQLSTAFVSTNAKPTVFAKYTLTLVSGTDNPISPSIVNAEPSVTVVDNNCDGTTASCTFSLALASAQPQNAVNAYFLQANINNVMTQSANSIYIPRVNMSTTMVKNLDTTISYLAGTITNPLSLSYHFTNNQTIPIDFIAASSSVTVRAGDANTCHNIAPGNSCDMVVTLDETQTGYAVLPQIQWAAAGISYFSNADPVLSSAAKIATQAPNNAYLIALTANATMSSASNQLILQRKVGNTQWQPMSNDLSLVAAAYKTEIDGSSHLQFSDIATFVDPKTKGRKVVSYLQWKYNGDWRSTLAVNDIGSTTAWQPIDASCPELYILAMATYVGSDQQPWVIIAGMTGVYVKSLTDPTSNYQLIYSFTDPSNFKKIANIQLVVSPEDNKIYVASTYLYSGTSNYFEEIDEINTSEPLTPGSWIPTAQYVSPQQFSQAVVVAIQGSNVYSVFRDQNTNILDIFMRNSLKSSECTLDVNCWTHLNVASKITGTPLTIAANNEALFVITDSTDATKSLYQTKDSGGTWSAVTLPKGVTLPLTGLTAFPTGDIQVIDSNKKRFVIAAS